MHRWQEECLLLTEEKQHVLKSFQHKLDQWIRHQSSLPDLELLYAAGVQAYAWRQADVYCRLGEHFRTTWNLLAEEAIVDSDSDSDAEEEGQDHPDAERVRNMGDDSSS